MTPAGVNRLLGELCRVTLDIFWYVGAIACAGLGVFGIWFWLRPPLNEAQGAFIGVLFGVWVGVSWTVFVPRPGRPR